MTPFELVNGAAVYWRPLDAAKPDAPPAPPVIASLTAAAVAAGGALYATVHHVHDERLVDLLVSQDAEPPEPGMAPPADASLTYVRFVPFLHEGDPDPLAPMGVCAATQELLS